MSGAPNVVIAATPEILFLDTPDCIAVAEYFTQRSKFTLTRTFPKRGLKVHVIPGDHPDPEKAKNGNRPYIRYSEYLKFLETISDTQKEEEFS